MSEATPPPFRRPPEGGYRTASPDTDEWAERLQMEAWGRVDLREKARMVSQLCRATHRLHLRGLALRHPRAGARELELRAAALRLGRETLERVLGHPLPFAD